MDSTSIELPGSEVDSIVLEGDILKVRFSRAYIVKSMTGSAERTRWWQTGELILEGASVTGAMPSGPLVCAGGEVGENIYTYRDMIPIPLDSRGRTRCALSFRDSQDKLLVEGETIRLDMSETPKYIEHIRPE